MENRYPTLCTTLLHRLLRFLLLCLLLPAVLQAQTITVQAAAGNKLPLKGFGKVPVSVVSEHQSFMVSGDDLTGDVTVAAPEGFQLRTGSNAFATGSLILSHTAGTLSLTTVEVRFAPVAGTTHADGNGIYAANVTISTPSASDEVAVAGEGVRPLLVELNAFTAKAEGKTAVQLAWSTATELRNDHFEVERSLNGQTFTALNTVAGAGTSNMPRAYSFRDTKLPLSATATVLYYRLRQVDANGQATYSPLRSVVLGGSGLAAQLQVYPYPAHGAVTVRILGPLPTAPLEVFDVQGRLVHRQPVSNSSVDTPLPLPGLPKGLYILRCGALSERLMVH